MTREPLPRIAAAEPGLVFRGVFVRLQLLACPVCFLGLGLVAGATGGKSCRNVACDPHR